MRWQIATGNGIIPGGMGLAQAHPPTNPPAMREQPSNGLGPVAVHQTHSGVGSHCFGDISLEELQTYLPKTVWGETKTATTPDEQDHGSGVQQKKVTQNK